MPKSLVLGNGHILVGFDSYAQVKDFYFPYVGLENQAGGRFVHKIGVYIDGTFSWLDDGTWDIKIDCGKETLASTIKATSHGLGIRIDFNDVVYNEKNIFIRKVTVHNLSHRPRQVKLFFHQVFEMYESHRGNTAFYDPGHQAIVHYKGKRVFLVNLKMDNKVFDDYCVGLFQIEGHEGSYKDAEDGFLSKNPIEHGLVDSVVAISFAMEPNGDATAYYWLASGKYLEEVYELNDYVLQRTPAHLIKTTQDFWYAWLHKQEFSFHGLEYNIVELFKKSLLFLRTHVDNTGSIVASADSDLLQYGRDTYCYVWPRDAAFTAIALDKTGDHNVAKRFFEYCNDIISPEGYFLHKYRPDKALGSSWHPWVRDGVAALPIQEDETALIVYSLWEHYEISRDLEFIENIYNSLIKKAMNFMVSYIDAETGLPKPSYDLWEEKYGVSTFTTATVYAAFVAASKFAKILGKKEHAAQYLVIADRMKEAILKYLYDEEKHYFYKMINFKNGEIIIDRTVDISSVYGIFQFGVLDVSDKRVQDAMRVTVEKLSVKTHVEGFARYEGDQYHLRANDVPGNPWFITSLWVAQYYIRLSKTEKDLEIVKKWLHWAVGHAEPSGILSEQLDPHTGQQLSVAPLTWSHGEYVVTIILYMEKLEELGVSDVFSPHGSEFTQFSHLFQSP